MIRATIKYSGTFIDKPSVAIIEIDENDPALERKNDTTGKYEKLPISVLWDSYYLKKSYSKPKRIIDKKYTMDQVWEIISNNPTVSDHIDPDLFEYWFAEKHLKGKGFYGRMISIQFEKIP